MNDIISKWMDQQVEGVNNCYACEQLLMTELLPNDIKSASSRLVSSLPFGAHIQGDAEQLAKVMIHLVQEEARTSRCVWRLLGRIGAAVGIKITILGGVL